MKLKSESITIETTNLCPAHCVMCPREFYTRKLGIMDMDLFKKIIDEASRLGVKTVDTCAFGDPFTDNLLFERCRYVREKMPDAKIYTSSNCFLLTPDKHNDVIKYIDILKISFYGMTKEIYEKIHRGSLKFEKTLNNVLSFLDKTNNLKKKPYTIGLLTLVDENKNEMEDWINFWEPKLDEVYVWMPHNFGGTKKYREIDRKNQKTCGRPLVGPPYIHVDGKVGVCCFDFNAQLIIGDIRKQTLEEIFHSKPYLRIKKAHETGNFEGYLCKNCDQTNYNSSVLIYASNKTREVGKINSNLQDLREI
ncbi:MAG: radical SAM protein [Candidatus Staskawiczbacteria bacterium]|jgi:radical SAM protein with 4Fe4S-binding SPASM domain